MTLNMAVGSERQKLAFVNGMSERTDRTISLHLRKRPGTRMPRRWPRSSSCSVKVASSTP